jgi:hypothetical protein
MANSPSRVEAFEKCGSCAFVYEATRGPADYCIRASHCHDRFCMPCASARSWAVAQEMQRLCHGKELRFITLTLQPRKGEGLREMLDRLYAGFRQLRRLDMWTEAVDGGVAVCEVKRTDAKRWHPHIHILCEGRYIDQGHLSKAWRGITGDSYIVDVRMVRDVEGSVQEITKYAAKPMYAGFWTKPELLEESMMALKGRKLLTTFGTWYNAASDLDELEEIPFAQDPREWRQMCTLQELHRRAINGDTQAHAIMAWLRVRDPITGERPPPSG